MTRNILFSHNDLDGIGSGIIFKKLFGSNSEVHYVGNHEVDSKVQDKLRELSSIGTYPSIYLTDISPNEESAEMLDGYPGEVVMLDHHESALGIAHKYKWATVDVNRCGTKLLYEYLIPLDTQFRLEPYHHFVKNVNDYDMWIRNLPLSAQLNRLFYILGIERFESRMLDNPSVRLSNEEVLLLTLEDETYERYLRRVKNGIEIFEWNGGTTFGVAYADRFHSEVAHELIEFYNIDAIALVDINSLKVSLRSRDYINVSKIAKEFGGGGHPNASGFSVNIKTVLLPDMLNALVLGAYEEVVSKDLAKEFGGV